MSSLGKTLRTPLVKASATGNDFLIVDLLLHGTSWEKDHGGRHRAKWVRDWCDRHRGIGADGALFLEAHHGVDFAWDFYNSDGSPAEMCGNAARAVALYMSIRHGRRDMTFQTRSGLVHAHVESADVIDISMAPVDQTEFGLSTKSSQISFDFVRAGVPHAVCQVPDLNARTSLREQALVIKQESRFQPDGTNVTFVRHVSANAIAAVTFERGVEDFTLSCGTGAVAAAHSILRGEENRKLEVHVPGGRLGVIWKHGRPHLLGPARIIAEIAWLTGGSV